MNKLMREHKTETFDVRGDILKGLKAKIKQMCLRLYQVKML